MLKHSIYLRIPRNEPHTVSLKNSNGQKKLDWGNEKEPECPLPLVVQIIAKEDLPYLQNSHPEIPSMIVQVLPFKDLAADTFEALKPGIMAGHVLSYVRADDTLDTMIGRFANMLGVPVNELYQQSVHAIANDCEWDEPRLYHEILHAGPEGRIETGNESIAATTTGAAAAAAAGATNEVNPFNVLCKVNPKWSCRPWWIMRSKLMATGDKNEIAHIFPIVGIRYLALLDDNEAISDDDAAVTGNTPRSPQSNRTTIVRRREVSLKIN
jgi:hypothetical protein